MMTINESGEIGCSHAQCEMVKTVLYGTTFVLVRARKGRCGVDDSSRAFERSRVSRARCEMVRSSELCCTADGEVACQVRTRWITPGMCGELTSAPLVG